MTTNRNNNNLFVTVDTTLKRTKVVFVIFVMFMMLSLVGCGEEDTTSEQDANAITTEEERTTQEDIDDNPELPGGEQEIATEVVLSTEATTETITEATTEVTTEATTEAPSGKYSYTIYGGIQVSLDTNVDDYIIVHPSGPEFFKLDELASCYGWKCENDEDFGWTQFTYDYNGCVIYFRYWCYEDKIEKSIDNSYGVGDSYQISNADYFFITEFGSGEALTDYYESSDSSDEHKYLSIDISKHYEECQYYVPGIGSMSRDDVILVAYLLESVSHNPGENPFCFINADDYQVNNDASGMNYKLPQKGSL